MSLDPERECKAPPPITHSTLRPDIFSGTEATKQFVLLSLMVPWEERMEKAGEGKGEKYQEQVEDCERTGWRSRFTPVGIQQLVGERKPGHNKS